jgi:long-chain acyl-CoA synthetase
VAPVWDFLVRRFPDHDLHPDQSLTLDLGIDSLDWVTLSLALSQELGATLTVEETEGLFTLRDLARLAAARRDSGGAADPSASALAPDALPPVPADLAGWLAPPGRLHRWVRPLVYAGTAAIVRGYFGRRVAGRGHAPEAGPALIACNHVSDVDAFIMVDALGRRRLRHVWWSGDVNRLFANRLSRFFARVSQMFPVDERDAGRTLAAARETLSRGRCLVWFPESWRSPDGALQRFLPGIGVLVRETGCPVVPARIFGAFEAWPRSRRWPRPRRVAIAFGPALDGARLVEECRADPQAIAARIREAIAAIEPPPGFR